MMLDAYQPEGVTMLAVDSIFMMPQLGILSTVHPEAATQVFERDCLIKLGSAVAPVGTAKDGETIATVTFRGQEIAMRFGTVQVLPLADGELAEIEIKPARGFNAGEGRGRPVTVKAEGGVVGLVLDAGGRPRAHPAEDAARLAKLREWFQAVQIPLPVGG
jgi:hypothetical protein